MLAERKGRVDDCGDQLLLVVTINTSKGAFSFRLLCKFFVKVVLSNLSLSVNYHKSTFRTPAVKKLAARKNASYSEQQGDKNHVL